MPFLPINEPLYVNQQDPQNLREVDNDSLPDPLLVCLGCMLRKKGLAMRD